MSRVGRKPVEIPKGVTVTIAGGAISVKGPKGELKETLSPQIQAELKDSILQLRLADGVSLGDASAIFGTSRARVNNMVQGVALGFSKVLEIIGVGFRAELAGQKLTLALGKSHPVIFEVPKGVTVTVDAKKTILTLVGANKDMLGQTASEIRALRPPEPYKGTGIRYQGERVRKKAGKTAAGAGAAGAGGAKK